METHPEDEQTGFIIPHSVFTQYLFEKPNRPKNRPVWYRGVRGTSSGLPLWNEAPIRGLVCRRSDPDENEHNQYLAFSFRRRVVFPASSPHVDHLEQYQQDQNGEFIVCAFDCWSIGMGLAAAST